MYPNAQVFFDLTFTFRAFLRCTSSINNSKEFPTLPTHILGDGALIDQNHHPTSVSQGTPWL